MKPIIIGIAGGTGSGKSTFTNRLKKAFGDSMMISPLRSASFSTMTIPTPLMVTFLSMMSWSSRREDP